MKRYSHLLDILSKNISSAPDIIQFTKDRKFEEAWIISLKKPKPSSEQIDKYLSREKFSLLIVEYIWNSDDNNSRFVFTFFLDKKCKLQNPKEFINICLNLFFKYKNFKEFISQLDTDVVGKDYLFLNPVESVNIGIFNHWFSVGPLDLWNKGQIYHPESIVAKIKSRPEIERSKLNYQGLFFRFNVSGIYNGPYYGLKTPCCTKENSAWVVNFDKINYWMNALLI